MLRELLLLPHLHVWKPQLPPSWDRQPCLSRDVMLDLDDKDEETSPPVDPDGDPNGSGEADADEHRGD